MEATRRRSHCLYAGSRYLHESDARGIVEADMNELPTDALVMVSRARISAGNVMRMSQGGRPDQGGEYVFVMETTHENSTVQMVPK
jgi:hypothetical protein